jgi:hypothetical protein
MKRWLAIGGIVAGAVITAFGVAYAIAPAQELIIFGGTSSASGSTPGGCDAGVLDFSVSCQTVKYLVLM